MAAGSGGAPGGVRLSVVLPAFREADVIGGTLAALRDGLSGVAPGDALELIVVDDGSDDATVERARAAGADQVIALGENRGKGAAVRTGMLAAAGEVVVFTDADLQYPPDRLVAVLARLDGEVGAVVARRERSGETPLRRLGTFTVSRLARALVLRNAAAGGDLGADTQCGLKAFRRDVAREVFGRCRVNRFGFDVEVLLLLSLLGIPTAVETVEAAAGTRRSTVRVVRDGVGILRDLRGIRRRLRRGDYDVATGPDD
ncbi:MAG: glycosyltransferase family 2 protein [bacterium]|nr:glycosyltransferase family 2 protein [bacterium]